MYLQFLFTTTRKLVRHSAERCHEAEAAGAVVVDVAATSSSDFSLPFCILGGINFTARVSDDASLVSEERGGTWLLFLIPHVSP